MPRPPTVTHETIIKHARIYFLKNGHTAPVKALAKELGITHAAIFQRFGSKKSLMIESLRPPGELPWKNKTILDPCTKSAYQTLLQLCQLLFNFFKVHSPCIQLLRVAGISIEEVCKDRRPLPLIACEDITGWLKRGVQKGIFVPCDEAAVALMIVGSLFARAEMQRIVHLEQHKNPTALGTIEGSLQVILQGLLTHNQTGN